MDYKIKRLYRSVEEIHNDTNTIKKEIDDLINNYEKIIDKLNFKIEMLSYKEKYDNSTLYVLSYYDGKNETCENVFFKKSNAYEKIEFLIETKNTLFTDYEIIEYHFDNVLENINDVYILYSNLCKEQCIIGIELLDGTKSNGSNTCKPLKKSLHKVK